MIFLKQIISGFVIIFMGLFFFSAPVFAGDARLIYSQVERNARQGNVDFAFMGCKNIIENYPKSKYDAACMFALGEYYYDLPNYEKAYSFFQQYIDQFPESEAKFFALAYLQKISSLKGDKSLIEEHKTAIIKHRQLSLVFRKKEKQIYRSALNNIYHAYIYINKIEFYVEGQILTKISY